MVELRSERLLLRAWRASDYPRFAALNADPAVMEYFPQLMTTAASDGLADRIAEHIDRNGWGLWAVEIAETGEFIGFTGLSRPNFDAHFTPAVEIGWRLSRASWGSGYATEAALTALDFGFGDIELPEIVSFTTAGNLRSRAVMERIGMKRDPADDFAHPGLPADHPLAGHVLYRIAPHDR